jgi:hypothetical protein
LARRTMSAVPRPPGNASTRSGLPSSSICWLRLGPPERPTSSSAHVCQLGGTLAKVSIERSRGRRPSADSRSSRSSKSGQRLVDTRQPSRLEIRHRLFACR